MSFSTQKNAYIDRFETSISRHFIYNRQDPPPIQKHQKLELRAPPPPRTLEQDSMHCSGRQELKMILTSKSQNIGQNL